MTTILSIQSSVAYGHAGNSAATFPLMRMGVEVWPVLTVHFSNHTEYDTFRGPLLAADDVADVVSGIDELGVLGGCDAVLSGYQGADDVGAVVLRSVALVKERNPDAIYCCDPVMGDVAKGFFVRPGIPALMRDQVVPRADVVTPNLFELEYLSGRTVRDTDSLLAAVDAVRATGPSVVLVTSVVHAATEPGTLQMVAVSDAGAWSVTTPYLALPPTVSGTGDITAALFLAHLLDHGDIARAVRRTAQSVFGVLEMTHRAGAVELALVRAQAEFVDPTHSFEVDRIR